MFVRSPIAAGLAAAAITALAAAPALAASSEPASMRHCFFVNQWEGWKAPTPDVLYLGVNLHDVYRVQLSGPTYLLQAPGVHLVSISRGSTSICNALDLDLRVSDGHGVSSPLIARSIVKLTPEEVAAIPPKFRP